MFIGRSENKMTKSSLLARIWTFIIAWNEHGITYWLKFKNRTTGNQTPYALHTLL